VIFLIGMVIALRLPPRADSDPPETLPRLFSLPGRSSIKVLSGRLVLSTLFGAVTLRALFGFLTLFLAFSVRSGHLPTWLLGKHLHQTTALGVLAAALGVGSFLAMAVGTRLRIRRPALLQAGSLTFLAAVALLAAGRFSLATVALFCLVTAAASGLAKLALDATIQERVPETVRASAFAHSETALMLAFVLGGGIGLVPFSGRLGITIAAIAIALAAVRGVLLAGAMRKEKLRGEAAAAAPGADAAPEPIDEAPAKPRWTKLRSAKAEKKKDAVRAAPAPPAAPAQRQETRVTKTIERPGPDAPGYHLYQPSGEKLVHPDEDED
jgi:hypothetical protein